MGERYEAMLADLYEQLLVVYTEHGQHELGALPARGPVCQHCGKPTQPSEAATVCPVSNQCDDLGDTVYELKKDAVERVEALDWLTDLGPGLLGWGFEVLHDNTPGEAIYAAIAFDVQERLFPNYATQPVDPARPADG